MLPKMRASGSWTITWYEVQEFQRILDENDEKSYQAARDQTMLVMQLLEQLERQHRS